MEEGEGQVLYKLKLVNDNRIIRRHVEQMRRRFATIEPIIPMKPDLNLPLEEIPQIVPHTPCKEYISYPKTNSSYPNTLPPMQIVIEAPNTCIDKMVPSN